jgi:hypothetical protein
LDIVIPHRAIERERLTKPYVDGGEITTVGAFSRKAPGHVMAREKSISVQTDHARLDDEGALARLLASIPHPPGVRGLLTKNFFGRRWQQAESCDYWLASDGVLAVCLKIRGATAAQVFAIRLRFDELAATRADLVLSKALLCELVQGVTGDCESDP